MYGVDYGPKWTVKYTAHLPVFRIPRRLSRLKIPASPKTYFRRIVNAERVSPVPMKCLRVSSDDSLFLVTEHFIPTHNTAGLLAAALQFVHIPGYTALLLRRTFSDLEKPKSLMHLSHLWLDSTNARWNGNRHAWTFPSQAMVCFGYLQNAGDRLQYRSAEYQFIGFDEVTEFERDDYLYLFTRLRRTNTTPVPLRMRCGTNPGGPGHEWVYHRFINPGHRDRMYIKATIDDNPHVSTDEYEESLSEVDPVLYAQMRNGDWAAKPSGAFFDRTWVGMINRTQVPPVIPRLVRFWDCAATKDAGCYTVGTLMGRLDRTIEIPVPADAPKGAKPKKAIRSTYYVLDVVREQVGPAEVEELMYATARRDGPGVKIRMEEEGGSSGKIVVSTYGSVMQGFDFDGVRATGPKPARWAPFLNACRKGTVLVVRAEWNENWIRELEGLPTSRYKDQADSAAGAYQDLVFGRSIGDYGITV